MWPISTLSSLDLRLDYLDLRVKQLRPSNKSFCLGQILASSTSRGEEELSALEDDDTKTKLQLPEKAP